MFTITYCAKWIGIRYDASHKLLQFEAMTTVFHGFDFLPNSVVECMLTTNVILVLIIIIIIKD